VFIGIFLYQTAIIFYLLFAAAFPGVFPTIFTIVDQTTDKKSANPLVFIHI